MTQPRNGWTLGNTWTGDITFLADLMPDVSVTDSNDNWVNGTTELYKVQAKIFNEPSSYGIKGGRISKLSVYDVKQDHWGFEGCFVNYDRGWDIVPWQASHRAFVNNLLRALGDDTATDEEFENWRLVNRIIHRE